MENEISLVDLAYNIMKTYYKSKKKTLNVKVPFAELLLKVGEEKGITNQNELLAMSSSFYTALTIDGRFFLKDNNCWSLKEHEKFEDIHIVNISSDDDIDDIDVLEDGEENEESSKKSSEEDDDYIKDDTDEYHIDTSESEEDENN